MIRFNNGFVSFRIFIDKVIILHKVNKYFHMWEWYAKAL